MGEPALSDWIGRVEEHAETVSPVTVNMLGATLVEDWDAASGTRAGAELPPLWHWGLFHQTVPLSEIARDGHPRLGRFLPPVALERRMWAGGRLTFHAALHVGERVHRRSEIRDITEKQGGAGRMVFVTVGHELHGEGGLAIEEEQDIVYIAMPDAYRPPKPKPAPEAPLFDERVAIDVVRLFRYSAATFNGHRIHYDLPYATEVEKYPGLVVQGPMQATLLMGAAVRHKGSAPRRFSFRGVHPMFHTHDLRLMAVSAGDDALELCTAAPRGDGNHQGLQARAEWGPA